jgi:hypothetical protein
MRNAYLLTTNETSARCIFSKKILENIGFNVIIVNAILNTNKVLSNKLSMMKIYNIIQNGNAEYAYVFEDDVNVVEPIYINEIIEYEKISQMFFYLGCCMMNNGEKVLNTDYKINNKPVMQVSGGIRGLHGIGISRCGATKLLEFINTNKNIYMDCILEDFSVIYPANVVRYDLVSPQINGHRGILFQDRLQFPSSI